MKLAFELAHEMAQVEEILARDGIEELLSDTEDWKTYAVTSRPRSRRFIVMIHEDVQYWQVRPDDWRKCVRCGCSGHNTAVLKQPNKGRVCRHVAAVLMREARRAAADVE